MKHLAEHSRWSCRNCGFETDGETWNSRWLRDFGLWGALYSCPNCKKEVELSPR